MYIHTRAFRFFPHGKTTMLFLPVISYFYIFIDISPAKETRAKSRIFVGLR